MRHKMLRLVLLMILVFGLAGGAAHAQTPDEMECLQAGGNLDPESGKCVREAGLEITINYPLDSDPNWMLRGPVDAFLDELQDRFLDGFVAYGLTAPSPAPWALYVDYTRYAVPGVTEGIVFSVYEYTGGANGNGTYRTFLYNANTSTPVALADLFMPGSNPYALLAQVVPAAIKAQVGDMADDEWIRMGSGENPMNYQNFMLTEDSLIFYFDEYQVAAGAAGPIEVAIPLTDLATILVPGLLP